MNSLLEQRLLKILIIVLPFHYLLFTILLANYDFLKYWKEIIIVISFFIILFKKAISPNNVYKLTLLDLSISMFILPVILSFVFLTEDKLDGLYMIRIYLQPFLVYFIVKNINMTKTYFNKLTEIAFNIAILISVYGLFQAIILGDQFLIKLGYPTGYDGRLTYPFYISGFGNFQRVTSTFVNPNDCALYLSFSLILVFINSYIFSKRKLIFGTTLILLAIFFTFSRSTWIPLIFVLINIVRQLRKSHPSLKNIILVMPFFLLIVLFIFSNIFDLHIFEKLYSFIYRTITLKDTSAAGRSGIWLNALGIIKDNPFGLGMGHTGALATVLGNKMIPAESSYLSIWIDFGIQGFTPFLIMFFSSIYLNSKRLMRYKRYKKIKLLNIGSILATTMILISMLFSNYIQDIDLFTIYYVIIGLGSNEYLYNILSDEPSC